MKAHARPILRAVFALFAALSPEGLLAGVGRWTSSGPDGGAVLALAAVPSDPSTVYLATGRRVYKSLDAGALWAPTGLSGYFVLVLTTSTPSVVYAADIDSERRIHRTTDGGENWVGRPGSLGRLVSATVDRNDPMALYAVTHTGLFRTTNGGDSWQRLANLPAGGTGLAGIAVDPGDSRVLYASLTVPTVSGVYRSSDRGATWNRTNLQDPTRTLLFDPSDDSRLFALTNAGLRVTTNRGQSWRRLAPEIQFPSHLAIDPADSNRLYLVSGGAVFYSSDGGETVTPVHDANLVGNVGAIAVSESSVVLAGSAKGLYRSQDAGRVWSPSDLGIREIDVRSLAIDPTNPAVVFAGSSQGIYESRDGGDSWNEPVPGSPETNVVAIDPTNRSTLYAAGRGVHKSTDGGETWENKSPEGILDYIAALVIDPSNPRRVFASNAKVFRSLDGTENWDVVMRAEDNVASYYYPPSASAMAIAPSDSATVYAGGVTNDYADGFVSRSEDGGTGWSIPAILDFPVTALVVDPCDPRIVYAGTYRGVYRSADGGATWSEPGLPGIFISSLVLDPRHSSSVFAGTSSGLFWTNDSGASWTRFEPILSGPVSSLAIDSSGRFLHVATREGVFDLERTFEPCAVGGNRLCLLGARFQLEVTARDPRTGNALVGQGVPDGDRFGYFSFPALTGDGNFPEVFVKMADATGLPAPYGSNLWLFHTALTDLDYTLTVRDTHTGRVRIYDSEKFGLPPAMACGEADTRAFDGACTVRTLSTPLADAGFAAVSTPALALLGGRFRATVRATDPRTGRTVEGEAVPKADGFGYFSLPGFTGDPSFPEVFVKMTDATALPGGYFWVFHTGLTDVEYTLTVTDQVTRAVKTYRRGAPDGTELCGEADTSAFRN